MLSLREHLPRQLFAIYLRATNAKNFMAIHGHGSAESPRKVIVPTHHPEVSIKALLLKDGFMTVVPVLSSEISWRIFDGLHIRGLIIIGVKLRTVSPQLQMRDERLLAYCPRAGIASSA